MVIPDPPDSMDPELTLYYEAQVKRLMKMLSPLVMNSLNADTKLAQVLGSIARLDGSPLPLLRWQRGGDRRGLSFPTVHAYAIGYVFGVPK